MRTAHLPLALPLVVMFVTGCPEVPASEVSAEDFAALQERVATLELVLEERDLRIESLEGKTAAIDADDSAVRFVGVNVYVQDGSGATVGEGNGTGNLIIGYDEGDPEDKTGSHNLVMGEGNQYLGSSGFVSGRNSDIGDFGFVLGGLRNKATDGVIVGSGYGTSIGGVIVGGLHHEAPATGSVIVGGKRNQTNGQDSVVLGGTDYVTRAEDEILP